MVRLVIRCLEMVVFVQVTDGCSWRNAHVVVVPPLEIWDASTMAHYKTLHTHCLMKISSLQLPIHSSAWSNCSFTELMRKWTEIKESFGCCISSREEAAFVFLRRAIISQLQPSAAPYRRSARAATAPFWNPKRGVDVAYQGGKQYQPVISLVFIFITKFPGMIPGSRIKKAVTRNCVVRPHSN